MRRRPNLPAELVFAWQAFWHLYGDRQLGSGACGPILWTSIDRYAERAGVTDPDEFERFRRRLQVLDDAYRAAIAAKRDEE